MDYWDGGGVLDLTDFWMQHGWVITMQRYTVKPNTCYTYHNTHPGNGTEKKSAEICSAIRLHLPALTIYA